MKKDEDGELGNEMGHEKESIGLGYRIPKNKV